MFRTLHRNNVHVLSPSCSAVCGHLFPGILNICFLATVGSCVKRFRATLVYFPHFPLQHVPFLPVKFILCHYTVPLSITFHKSNSVQVLLPPLDYWYTSFLGGRGHPRKIALVTISGSPQGRGCRYVFIPTPSLHPPYILRCSSSPTFCLLTLVFPSQYLYHVSFVLYLPGSPKDMSSSWFLSASLRTFSTNRGRQRLWT